METANGPKRVEEEGEGAGSGALQSQEDDVKRDFNLGDGKRPQLGE